MVSRREFLQSGLAAATVPLVTSAGFLAPSAGAAPVPLYKAIFDTRYDASRQFAAALSAQGVPTHGIAGDITSVWYHDLHHRWQASPVAIAGLTGHGAMFCLEHLAWDHRMRVVYRAEHRPVAGGRVEHVVTAAEPLIHRIRDAIGRGHSWGSTVASVVTRISASGGRAVTTTLRSDGERLSAPLHSWMIAPLSQA